MPVITQSQARTRAFARVVGPWLVLVPGIIALRAPDMGALASEFFDSPLFVWFSGALLLFAGLFIIAFHSYWGGAAAILISLFGWVLAIRGLVLMAAPALYERAVVIAEFDLAGAAHVRPAHRHRRLSHLCRLDRQTRWVNIR